MRLFTMLLAALIASPAAAEIYKWVDEDGNVHYSQRRPPDESRSQTTETLDLRSGGTSKAARQELQQDIERADKLREERLQRQAEQQQAAAEQAARKRNCEDARTRLKNLQEAQRIYHVDEQGNRIRVGEEERQADMAAAREQIAEYCR